MTRLTRMCAAVLTAGLVFAAQAGAAPPGEEEFTVVEPFPCLGEPGIEDDLAEITVVSETSNFGITRWRVIVDPVTEGLPNYTGFTINAAQERVTRGGEHFHFIQRFVATAVDGSDRFTFHIGFFLSAGPDGEVRSVHLMDKFCSNE
jgi:hypothetical protein